MNDTKIRRFRGKGGWAPETDYIAYINGESYIVTIPINRNEGDLPLVKWYNRSHTYPLAYIMEQVDHGNWEELEPTYRDRLFDLSHDNQIPKKHT